MGLGVSQSVRAPAAVPRPVTHGRLAEFPRDALSCMRRLYRTHGTIAALEEDGQRLIFVFGPEYNRRVLSDSKTFHSQFFTIRGPRNSAQRRLTSTLLSMNGEEHKRHRRLVMGPFQKQSIEGYRDALAALIEDMLRNWQPGQVRDIFEDMTHFMLCAASSILFGFDVRELAYTIGDMTARWVAMNHELGIGAFISDERITASYHELLAQAEALEKEVRAMIEHRRSSSNLGSDVLSLLIRAHDENGAGMTDAELVGQSAVLFGAAHLTTANSLTWTLFLLAQHPEVASELVAELYSVLHGEVPTVAQLECVPMLERVIKESMRVLPASSYSQRVNVEPVELGPFRVSKGTPIVFSQFVTHHMPELYSEPERFLPERWRTIAPSPYAYLPFGAGSRLCLGGPLAMMTMKLVLPAILQRYRLSVVPAANINGKVISTMLTPTTGMPMLVSPPSAPFKRTPVCGNIHDMVTLQEGAGPSSVFAGSMAGRWPVYREPGV
jgi:cytochrome P450